MSAMEQTLTGASFGQNMHWDKIDWPSVYEQVRRMQMRIAKAIREKRFGKAKALQRLLSTSFYAKLLAVKRVTENRGSKTAGVDQVIWKTPKQKMKAVHTIKRRSYKTQPLRRIYIPKRNGKKRPLSIPTMTCRTHQALHLMGLEPIVETLADPNSYGFRPKRSTADAIAQCFLSLCRKTSPQWILEGDIKSCFDKIEHGWLLTHIPMDKVILGKWLKAGYLENEVSHPTKEGVPQGGVISPCILTMTMSGLEAAIKRACKISDKVNVIIYADDFVVTGASKEILEQQVKPVIQAFLKERGLELSEEKSKITHIDEGFDFLGFNVRKYNGKLLIKPAKRQEKDFLMNIRNLINKNKTTKTIDLIRQLNPKIRGWANYFRHQVSKKTFQRVDHFIFKALWRWTKRRHPEKGTRWVKKKYFSTLSDNQWVFYSNYVDKDGVPSCLYIWQTARTPIKRHIKIKAEANPYDPNYRDYFTQRENRKRKTGPD
jgi:RNA-directed DNA polymerase